MHSSTTLLLLLLLWLSSRHVATSVQLSSAHPTTRLDVASATRAAPNQFLTLQVRVCVRVRLSLPPRLSVFTFSFTYASPPPLVNPVA